MLSSRVIIQCHHHTLSSQVITHYLGWYHLSFLLSTENLGQSENKPDILHKKNYCIVHGTYCTKQFSWNNLFVLVGWTRIDRERMKKIHPLSVGLRYSLYFIARYFFHLNEMINYSIAQLHRPSVLKGQRHQTSEVVTATSFSYRAGVHKKSTSLILNFWFKAKWAFFHLV
jgi:hypothetical protein